MPQNATLDELSPSQLIAIEALAQGETVTESANRGRVCRETVHRWMRDNPAFQATLNQIRNQSRREVEDRLRAAAPVAAANIARAIDEGNLTASLALLKGLGALPGKPLEVGSDDAIQLERDAERERWREAEATMFDRALRPMGL